MTKATDTAARVRATLQGDLTAFSALVVAHQGAAYGYALAQLRDPAAAQDAVQDALVDAYLELGQLREPAAFAGWLRRIVFKHCDRQRRRPKPRPVAPRNVAEVQSHHDDTPEQQLAEAQQRDRLLDAIETLPEHERFVVALHYLAGQPVKAIADFLSLSLSAVKKRLFSARNRLIQEDNMLQAHTRPVHFEDSVTLFLAIRAGDHATVRRILTQHPELLDAEERWSDEEALAGGFTLAHHLTPLILAAGYGDREMVDLLLALGARPEGRCGCDNGETAAWAAARAGFDAVTKRLLAAGADPTATNGKGYDVDELRAWRDTTPTSAASVDDDRVTTGIKALDLWLPLKHHDVVRVHGAAETGLTVLLSEVAGMIGRAGGRTVWTSWEPRPWHRRELEVLARRGAVDPFVDIVTPSDDEDRQAVLSRGLEKARTLDHPLTVHVIFEQEGRRSLVESRFTELSDAATLTFVVCPWAAVTRGDEAPSTEEPHDALLVTDPRLAAQWLYPAIDPQRSRTKRDDTAVTRRARALLEHYAAIDPTFTKTEGTPDEQPILDRARRLLSYLTQPFACAEPDTGWPGVSVPAEQTHRDAARILDGELDTVPVEELRFRGPLD